MIVVIIIVSAIVLFILSMFLGGLYFSEPVYKGPKTDHFDGKYFHNPDGRNAKEMKDVMKWSSSRKPKPWYENYETTVRQEPILTAPQEEVLITFVNHSTFLLQTNGKNILFDPVWSKRVSPLTWAGPKRMRPPGVNLDDLPSIDLILLSHNHYDHLDISTIRKLEEKFKPQFIVPLGVDLMLHKRKFGNIKTLDWWQEEIFAGLKIQATPANHFSGRGLGDRNRTLWCGYYIKKDSATILYVGDTGYGNIFKKIREEIGPVDLAMIPIGAYEPRWFMSPIHISPDEAVKVHQDLESKKSIAMHFGTFPLADEGQGGAERDLIKSLNEAEIPANQFIIPEEGKTYSFKF